MSDIRVFGVSRLSTRDLGNLDQGASGSVFAIAAAADLEREIQAAASVVDADVTLPNPVKAVSEVRLQEWLSQLGLAAK